MTAVQRRGMWRSWRACARVESAGGTELVNLKLDPWHKALSHRIHCSLDSSAGSYCSQNTFAWKSSLMFFCSNLSLLVSLTEFKAHWCTESASSSGSSPLAWSLTPCAQMSHGWSWLALWLLSSYSFVLHSFSSSVLVSVAMVRLSAASIA